MKRIYKNSDLKLKTSEIPNLGERFIILFFTTNKKYSIRKTDQDIIIDDEIPVIKLNWTELATIGRGVLNYILVNIEDDEDYDDGDFDNSFSGTTEYYVVSDIVIDDGDDDITIREMLLQIENQLISEIQRSTQKDNEHDVYLEESELVTASALNDLNKRLERVLDAIDDYEVVIASALNDLNKRLIELENNN